MRYPSFLIVPMLIAAFGCQDSLTVSGQSSISSNLISVDGLSVLMTHAGDSVAFTGDFLSSKLEVQVNGNKVDSLIVDSKHGSFTVPSDTNPNPMLVEFFIKSQSLGKFPLVDSDTADQIPMTSVAPESLCSYTVVKDAQGNITKGLAECGSGVPDCSYDGQINCKANSSFPAADQAGLAAKVLVGETVAAISGSAEKRPESCSSDGQGTCVVDGTLFKAAQISGFSAADIRNGVSVAGVSGILTGALPACSSDGEAACLVDGTNYKSASMTSATAANIRSGVTIAGITGGYPSSGHPLIGADTTSDLAFSTFNAQLASSSLFEWFDSSGARHSNSGSTNLKAEYIVKDKALFGVTGTFTGVGSASASNLSATVGSSKNIISWTGSGSPVGYILVRRANLPVIWTPTATVSYSVGTIDSDQEIIYKGTALTVDDTSGVFGTNYYYSIFAFDSENLYSKPIDNVSSVLNTYVLCGDSGNLCYDNASALSSGSAQTPSGKFLTYVVSSGTFKVWREVSGTRILKADGSDNWAKKLNTSGMGFTSTDFSDYTKIDGRVCPPNVYIDDSNKFTTGNCLYYGFEGAQSLDAAGTDGVAGLGNWSTGKWFEGNIATCGNSGMRLPTIFETTKTDHTSESSWYPTSDGTPTWAESSGVPSSGATWTATTGHDTQSYWYWENTGIGHNYYGDNYTIACVLP